MSKNVIEVQDLKKSFDGGHKFVLDGLSLAIPKGQLVAVIGFSGTGKSVLLKHLLGFMKPTSGSVHILGENIHSKSYKELVKFRYKLGVLFQNVALFDDMTVMENVLFPLNEHRKEMSPDQKKEMAEKQLVALQIFPKDFDKLPSEISGGMQKRVGLARTLVLKPEILFYDEPTTGLDPTLSLAVDELILNTHKSLDGVTSIFITHDLKTAFQMADYVIMLDSGKVLEQGPPDELKNTQNERVKKFLEVGLYR